MSWNDFYRRRDALDALLRQARRDPRAPLPCDHVDGVRELFGSDAHVLLALQHRWLQRLSGRLRSAVGGPEDTGDIPAEEDDHVEAVAHAWRSTVSKNQTLREVLDAHLETSPTLRQAYEGELRMLATTAGLAQPGESQDELTRVGNAFVELLRNRAAEVTPARSTNPVGALLRKLAPTG